MIQIIEIRGVDPPRTPVVFDSKGKIASKKYYSGILQDLANIGMPYCNSDFRKDDQRTIQEIFYKVDGDKLIPAADFDDCDFYECNFFMGDPQGNDLGIVSFCYYAHVNAGCQVRPSQANSSSLKNFNG